MIGKFAKPRCFKNVNMDALPVIYKSQKNAWMNSEIFAEWFKKDFVPAVKRHQRAQNIRSPKALLLIDNCSAHPQELKTCDGSVTCMFLPPNTTSLIQPMDQGVLQAMKNHYKRKLLQKVICDQDLDPTQNIKEIVKQLTVKDALYMLAMKRKRRKAKMIKSFQTLKLLNVLRSVYRGWKDRVMLTLFRSCSFEE